MTLGSTLRRWPHLERVDCFARAATPPPSVHPKPCNRSRHCSLRVLQPVIGERAASPHVPSAGCCRCDPKRPRHAPLLLGIVRTPLNQLGICSLQTIRAARAACLASAAWTPAWPPGLHATMPAASRREGGALPPPRLRRFSTPRGEQEAMPPAGERRTACVPSPSPLRPPTFIREQGVGTHRA